MQLFPTTLPDIVLQALRYPTPGTTYRGRGPLRLYPCALCCVMNAAIPMILLLWWTLRTIPLLQSISSVSELVLLVVYAAWTPAVGSLLLFEVRVVRILNLCCGAQMRPLPKFFFSVLFTLYRIINRFLYITRSQPHPTVNIHIQMKKCQNRILTSPVC